MICWNDFEMNEAGRALGHDFYKLSLIAPHASWPAVVREGFEAAAHTMQRRQRSDRYMAKWLQLRLSAWRRGRRVADDVTPALLRDIDVLRCPITRQPLTHGSLQDTDWSVDRLNNDAAYAASNLAVMSVKANRAKGALGFQQVYVRSQLAHDSDGLRPAEWLRLAVLMLGPAYATQAHAAPILPLCAPLPCRSVRLATQQVQRLLTVNGARHADKNRLIRTLAQACTSEIARERLLFLGEVVHEGLKRIAASEECWDVWLQPAVLQALMRWHDALDPSSRARVAALSGQLSGARPETPRRLQAWCLPTRGYAPRLVSGWC